MKGRLSRRLFDRYVSPEGGLLVGHLPERSRKGTTLAGLPLCSQPGSSSSAGASDSPVSPVPLRPYPAVRFGPISVAGGTAKELVRRVLHSGYGWDRLCYHEGWKRDMHMAGTVTIRFVIGLDGSVLESTVAETDGLPKEIALCLADGIYLLEFVPPEVEKAQVVTRIALEPPTCRMQ